MTKVSVMVPTPFNEQYRLLALHGYNVLDTPPEPEFDRIVRLAASYFRVPIALISLVDPTRQWFKASVGLEARETPREVSFCGHAIINQDVMQVSDAALDPRFSDNPLVTGDPYIRFYAGAPLVTPQGFCLGTLCIIDTCPHGPLTEIEETTLRDLAAIVIDELERRRIRDPQAASSPPGNGVQPADPHWRTGQQEVANEAMFDLLASLSHEFRTPLNAIMGFSETISKEVFGPLDNPKYLAYANHIFDSGDHLLGLTEEILDFCRLKSGEITLHEETIDPDALVGRCLDMFSELARRAEITLESDLANGMPWLKADRQQLMQMLLNLIGNSIKYTRPGGTIRVSLGVDVDGSPALAVSDTGIGIAPEDIEKTLAPFGQIDNVLTRKHSGTGLGLPLTRRLIELHGGRMAIASRLKVGTTVILHFPSDRMAQRQAGVLDDVEQAGEDVTKSIA